MVTGHGAQPDTITNDGRANLPVCQNPTASKRSDAGGTILGIRTQEHRSRSCGSLGGAAAPPYLGGAGYPAGTKAKCWRLDDFRFIDGML